MLELTAEDLLMRDVTLDLVDELRESCRTLLRSTTRVSGPSRTRLAKLVSTCGDTMAWLKKLDAPDEAKVEVICAEGFESGGIAVEATPDPALLPEPAVF
jgi:hypothetical protein